MCKPCHQVTNASAPFRIQFDSIAQEPRKTMPATPDQALWDFVWDASTGRLPCQFSCKRLRAQPRQPGRPRAGSSMISMWRRDGEGGGYRGPSFLFFGCYLCTNCRQAGPPTASVCGSSVRGSQREGGRTKLPRCHSSTWRL